MVKQIVVKCELTGWFGSLVGVVLGPALAPDCDPVASVLPDGIFLVVFSICK